MNESMVDGAAHFAAARLLWSERDFQEAVIDMAKTEYGWTHVYHTYRSDRSERGFPDLVLLRPGREGEGFAGFWGTGEIIFAELKSMRGKISLEQASWYQALRTVPYLRVRLWRPCCWNSGEIQAALQGERL